MITSKSRRATVAVVAVFAATLLTGCAVTSTSSVSGDAPVANGRVVALIVDQTCDASPELTSFVPAALRTSIGAAAQDQGTFLAEGVTINAYQRSTFNVRAEFTSDRLNEDGVKEDLGYQADDFLNSPGAQKLTKGYKPGTSCGSDLINALTAAGRAVGALPNAGSRAKDVVFLTNGIVMLKGGPDFVHDRLDGSTTSRLIAKKKAKGLFPDLAGVHMHFVGLGVADRPITAEQVRAIERFWVVLAKDAGAASVDSLRSGEALYLAPPGGNS